MGAGERGQAQHQGYDVLAVKCPRLNEYRRRLTLYSSPGIEVLLKLGLPENDPVSIICQFYNGETCDIEANSVKAEMAKLEERKRGLEEHNKKGKHNEEITELEKEISEKKDEDVDCIYKSGFKPL